MIKNQICSDTKTSGRRNVHGDVKQPSVKCISTPTDMYLPQFISE
ncbi:4.1 G protein, putative [Schistosoma mansoni]|uniref:4.1 G protein, putative n=1 Tax=Schistosoma mansoni TaxID=6183 RepID=G4LUX0_SCHMA|nr:4.1 G protein, putative [Schistosoma mansoni]|eukprot:XP_018645072.1 4.1 G protein, putative [Schistosoma mansoni]